MIAIVKVVVLLLAVITAAALEKFDEVDFKHKLHPYLSPAPSPSTHVDVHNKGPIFCSIRCAFSCHKKSRWRKVFCIALCLAQCYIGPSESVSEIACAADCAQSSTNNLRNDMMDDSIRACSQQCKKV